MVEPTEDEKREWERENLRAIWAQLDSLGWCDIHGPASENDHASESELRRS